MTTNLLTLPPPVLPAVKDSMFINRGGRGGRGRSCLWLRGEEEEEEAGKEEEEKIKKSHIASPQQKQSCDLSKIVSVLVEVYYPHQSRDSVHAVYAGFFYKLIIAR